MSRERRTTATFHGGELVTVHHRRCPCDDCGLDREVGAALATAKPADLTEAERADLADIYFGAGE